MVTDDERREVAARMRGWCRETPTCFNDSDMAWFVFGGSGTERDRDTLMRLADLIEPQERTCHIVPFEEEYMTLPHCSACGNPILKPWPNYCGQCGARITEVDE